MYNNSQSPIMVISGKKAEKMLSKSEKPIADHTKTIDRAKDKLRKMGKKWRSVWGKKRQTRCL